ncbi:MAG: hypothetical protein PHQ23_05770 [Candidatus Wallbacteria bacterium]|nr:hypothetical protein [Candidatus Wallbacteria bacterium]
MKTRRISNGLRFCSSVHSRSGGVLAVSLMVMMTLSILVTGFVVLAGNTSTGSVRIEQKLNTEMRSDSIDRLMANLPDISDTLETCEFSPWHTAEAFVPWNSARGPVTSQLPAGLGTVEVDFQAPDSDALKKRVKLFYSHCYEGEWKDHSYEEFAPWIDSGHFPGIFDYALIYRNGYSSGAQWNDGITGKYNDTASKYIPLRFLPGNSGTYRDRIEEYYGYLIAQYQSSPPPPDGFALTYAAADLGSGALKSQNLIFYPGFTDDTVEIGVAGVSDLDMTVTREIVIIGRKVCLYGPMLAASGFRLTVIASSAVEFNYIKPASPGMTSGATVTAFSLRGMVLSGGNFNISLENKSVFRATIDSPVIGYGVNFSFSGTVLCDTVKISSIFQTGTYNIKGAITISPSPDTIGRSGTYPYLDCFPPVPSVYRRYGERTYY